MSTSKHAQAKFVTGSLFKHVSVMAFTASIGLMAVFAVDFVDIIFISLLGKPELAAAIGYSGTVMFFTGSIGIGMSIASGVMVSRNLGAEDPEDARQAAVTVLILGFLISVAISILIALNMRAILGLLGADAETQELAVGYLTILLPSAPMMMIAMNASAVLRAHGDANRAMWSTLFGAIINAVLDPILIFGLDMELQGAALASAISRVAMALIALRWVILVYRGYARPEFESFRSHFKLVFFLAIPSMLTNIATPVGTAIVTREMAKFGTDAVAGAAIVNRMIPVSFAVIFALSGAIGPIIGQNAGAKLWPRVRRAFFDAVIFCAGYVVVIAIVLYVARPWVAALFQVEGTARDLIYLFCGPLALMFFFNGIIFICNAAFNNLGQPLYSTTINWARNTIGTYPLIWLFTIWYGAGGVLIGQAVGGLIFAIIATFFALRLMRKNSGAEPPKDKFTGMQRIHALFGRRSL